MGWFIQSQALRRGYSERTMTGVVQNLGLGLAAGKNGRAWVGWEVEGEGAKAGILVGAWDVEEISQLSWYPI